MLDDAFVGLILSVFNETLGGTGGADGSNAREASQHVGAASTRDEGAGRSDQR